MFKLGDKVKIVKVNVFDDRDFKSYVGRKGKLIRICGMYERQPYLVEFTDGVSSDRESLWCDEVEYHIPINLNIPKEVFEW